MKRRVYHKLGMSQQSLSDETYLLNTVHSDDILHFGFDGQPVVGRRDLHHFVLEMRAPVLLHVAQLPKGAGAVRTLVRLRVRVYVDVVDVRGQLLGLLAAVLARVLVLVAVHQHVLHQAALGAETLGALGARVRPLIRVYEQVVLVHAGVLAQQVAESTLDALLALVLRLVEQNRDFGRALDVRVANVAEELLDRLEHLRVAGLLVDDAADVVVAGQLRLVGEATVAARAAEVFLVLQQLVLGVRARRLEAFAADLAHVSAAFHVDEHVVRDGGPSEEAFAAVVADEVLAAGVHRDVHVIILHVRRHVVALPALHEVLAVVLRQVEQVVGLREDLLVAFLRETNSKLVRQDAFSKNMTKNRGVGR